MSHTECVGSRSVGGPHGNQSRPSCQWVSGYNGGSAVLRLLEVSKRSEMQVGYVRPMQGQEDIG